MPTGNRKRSTAPAATFRRRTTAPRTSKSASPTWARRWIDRVRAFLAGSPAVDARRKGSVAQPLAQERTHAGVGRVARGGVGPHVHALAGMHAVRHVAAMHELAARRVESVVAVGIRRHAQVL